MHLPLEMTAGSLVGFIPVMPKAKLKIILGPNPTFLVTTPPRLCTARAYGGASSIQSHPFFILTVQDSIDINSSVSDL